MHFHESLEYFRLIPSTVHEPIMTVTMLAYWQLVHNCATQPRRDSTWRNLPTCGLQEYEYLCRYRTVLCDPKVAALLLAFVSVTRLQAERFSYMHWKFQSASLQTSAKLAPRIRPQLLPLQSSTVTTSSSWHCMTNVMAITDYLSTPWIRVFLATVVGNSLPFRNAQLHCCWTPSVVRLNLVHIRKSYVFKIHFNTCIMLTST
jgi:hypothetical protein